MHLSNHLTDRWVASMKRSASAVTLDTTSSNCMMMSAPGRCGKEKRMKKMIEMIEMNEEKEWWVKGMDTWMIRRKCERIQRNKWAVNKQTSKQTVPISFWHWILCSGVRSISDPSIGDLNVTPSSVISANLSRETWEIIGGEHEWCERVYEISLNVTTVLYNRVTGPHVHTYTHIHLIAYTHTGIYSHTHIHMHT